MSYRWKTVSFHVRLRGSKRSFEFLWFLTTIFCEKKRRDPQKFCGSCFPTGDLFDTYGKTVSFHVRLSISRRSFEFLWFYPPVFVKKNDDPLSFVVLVFQGGCFVWYRWENGLIQHSHKSFQSKIRIFAVWILILSEKRCWLTQVSWFSFSRRWLVW